MSLHQKRVTITAVDLSKAKDENCAIVVHWEGEELTADEIGKIRRMLIPYRLEHLPVISLKKGQTLTVEQLPPRTEKQIIDDFRKLADSKQPAPEAQKEQKEQVIEIDEDGKVHGNITGPLREP